MRKATFPTPPADALTLSLRDAARRLGVSQRHLWTLVNAGTIPHVRLDRRLLIPVETLRDWLGGQARKRS